MKSITITILLSIFTSAAFAVEIASVNFNAIKDELRAYYFSKPGNQEIKNEFLNATEQEKKMMADMQATISEGKPSIDISKMIPKAGATNRFQLERKIDADLKKELYLIISQMGLKYDFIYDASDTDAVIYSKSQIEDITIAVKQAIIDSNKQ